MLHGIPNVPSSKCPKACAWGNRHHGLEVRLLPLFCWTEKPGSNSLTKYRSSQPNAQSKIGRPQVDSFGQVCLQLPRGTTQGREQQALPAVTNKTKALSCGPMPARQLAWPRVPQGNRSPRSVAAVAMASHTEWPC